MNQIAKETYTTALKRGQIGENLSDVHRESYLAIREELQEYFEAKEYKPSEHIPQYSEAEEELADILITCLTELYRRRTNINEIVKAKIEYNKTRKL